MKIKVFIHSTYLQNSKPDYNPFPLFTNRLIDHMNGILEKYLWSSAYWEYRPGMENDTNFSALRRAYPIETEGELVSYHHDRESGTLEVTFKGTKTLCYVPFANWEIHSDWNVHAACVKKTDGRHGFT